MTTRANWNYPNAVRFGAGRIKELPDALAFAGIRKPLFVTDPGLAKLPSTASALKVLEGLGAVELTESQKRREPGVSRALFSR